VLHLLLLKRTDLVLFFFFPLFCPLVFFNFIFFRIWGTVLWCALNQGGGKFIIVFLKLKIEEKGGGKYGIRVGLGSGHLYSGWIGSGTNRFGSFRVRVYIGSMRVRVGSGSVRFISDYGSNRVNKISVRFGFGSGHIGFRVNSGCYSFGSVRFWVVQFRISG